MKRASIKIEVLEEGQRVKVVADVKGETWALMLGITNTIKDIEKELSEEDRGDYRARILEMLNDRH